MGYTSFYQTLCSNFDLGTSGQRSVLDLVRPVITISTAEFLLAGLSPPAEEAPKDGRLLDMLAPFVYAAGMRCFTLHLNSSIVLALVSRSSLFLLRLCRSSSMSITRTFL